jgi:filamentous hemagglutinin
VLTWDSFSIGGTNNVAFSRNGNAAFTVLNIVTGPTASDLRGALTGNGNGSIWLINPNGIAFNGNGSATNLASLVLSTLPLTEVNGAAYDAASFTGANGSTYRFAGNGTAGITIAANGSLAAGSNLLLVAPQIATAGTLAAGGDAALVVAADTRIAVSASGLLSITIDAGSAVANGLDISGGVTANRLYAVAASAADIAANLLSISGPLVSPNIVVAVGRSAAGSGVSFGAAATSTANVAISRNLPDSGSATSISVESTGDIAVTGAGNADRTITGSYVADGAVSITAGGNLSFANNASVSAGNALLASGDSVTLGTGVALRSDSAGAGGFDLTITANGNNRTISGDATSSLAAGMRGAGGTEGRTSDVVLTQDAGQALSLGRIDARQLVLTNAASAITLGDVTTTNALALTANGAISLASATSTASGVTLLSNTSSVSVGNTGSAAAFDISLTGVGVSSTGSAVSGKDFKVDATTGIATVAGNVTADGIIDVLGGSVVLGTSGQSRTQQAMGLARYEATAGSLSTAGATAIISNSANNVAGANLSLKASAAIAAGAATLSAGTNDAGRRDVSLSAGGTAALTTGAIYANSVGTLDQAGTITIARIDSATAVAATSTAGSVFIGTAGAGNESRAPSFTVTANTAGQTASVVNAIAATGNIMAQATGGSAIANGSGDSIIAMGGNADASGTAATNIIAMATAD